MVDALAGAGNPHPPHGEGAGALGRRAAWLARVNLGLGMAVVALGIMLART